MDLADLTIETFRPLAGDTFDDAGAGIVLVLESVDDLTEVTSHPGDATRTPFSLVFSGPAIPVAPQGIRALTHELLGRIELFLVPYARDANSTRYEAIFS